MGTLYERIISRQLIEKGWSVDRKYCVATEDSQRYLLRISPKELYEKRRHQYARMEAMAQIGISMCLPLEFGVCGEGVYAIHSWIDGEDAEDVLPRLSREEQYHYGVTAGSMLRKLHSLPPPEGNHDWEAYFSAKCRRKIQAYENCSLKYPNGEAMIRYLKNHMNFLRNRPVCYQHGDYHTGNMMVGRDGILYIIDFEKDDIGDPWEEFNRIVWCAQLCPEFARGMVDGYFEGKVPQEFWELMAFYICSNSLGSLPWAMDYGEQEIITITRQAGEILAWYDDMKTVVPKWYIYA